MAEQNNFWINLVAVLQKSKSKKQVQSDAKNLGDIYIPLIGRLNKTKTKAQIKQDLSTINGTVNLNTKINSKGVQTATRQAINNAQRVANNNKVHLNFDTSKQQLINQIKILGRNNNKLFNDREMTTKFNQLLNSANVAKSTSELKTLRGELSAFKTELVATNNAGMTWGSKFKESIKSYAKFFSGASMIYAISNQVRNAATEAKTSDDSLVNLQKVTDEIANRDALYKYFDKSLKKAQELNVKVGSLIDAVTEFKKLGWSLEDAELGAKWANILSNVGDTNIETAIGSIKTSIASFDEIGGYGNDQMDKKLEAYTDLINNMSNKYSIDAEGLAESIRLSAGTLTEAHTSIEQAATMFATANKYYNDPSYLGNTAKIGSLRMRASTGDKTALQDLQEMGEEVDDLATATSNLREKLMALTGVDIMVDDHTFKSYYDQLYEISQVMDKLDDTSRANVLETMFGKSRSAAGAAILSGMKESASAYEDAINSAGSATEEYQTWMTSADAACQRFSNTLTQTYQSIINGNTVRDLANLGSAVLEFANNWGIVEGTLKGVIALNLGKLIATGGMALITATKQVEQYGKALQMASNVPNGSLSAKFQALKSIAQATSSLTTEQLRSVLATKTLTQADRVRILQMQGMTKEMALQKLAEMNLTQSTNAQTAANNASTASTFSLKAAMTGLGATLKSIFLNNPVGIVLMGISLGVSAVTSAVSKHNQAVEEERQKAKEAADTANTLSTELSDLANKYIQLSEAVKTDSASKEDLMSVQDELIKKLGIEGQSVDDLISKYGSLDNALKNITLQELGNQENDLIAGVKAAKEELKDIGKGYEHWYSLTDRNLLSSGGDDAVKAYEVLEKANLISKGSYDTGGGAFVLTGDDETVEGILENYQKLEDAMTALRESGQFTETELAKNPVFSQIYNRSKEMEEFVNGYNDAVSNLNKNVAEQQTITLLQGNEIPKTEKEFETFRQELIDTSVASKKFIGNEKEITDAINNYLSTVPQFKGFYSIPLENELDKVDELLNQEDFSKTSEEELKTQVETLNSAIDSIQSAYDTLQSAVDEYNSQGSLSLDTVQSLINMDDAYLACLVNENGQLSLNTDTMAQLAQAKLDEAQATAVSQAMTELQAIANGEAAASTTNYISGNAALMSSLAQLSGSYDGVAKAAMTAAQAQALSAQISAATQKDAKATANVMSGLNAKLQLIQSTQKKISAGGFGSVAKKSGNSKSGGSKPRGSKSGGSSGKSEADKAKEYLDAYMTYMEKSLDAGKITYQEYVDQVTKKLDKMYQSGKISAKDYFDYVEKKLNQQLDVYKVALSGVISLIDAEIDKLQDKIDAIKKRNDALNDEKDKRDSALSAIQKVYDDEIKTVESEKDAIQDVIDSLSEENDERERQMALQKAQAALDKALSQRTKKVLTKDGFVYKTDSDAITDAKEQLADAKYNIKVADLQKQQQALDDYIDTLNKYKDKWAEVSNAYQTAQDEINAKLYLGSEYQKTILANNIADIENFKEQYVSIQGQIASNELEIESLEQKKEIYSDLKDQWNSISSAYEDNINRQYAAMILGANWESDVLNGRVETLNNFKNQYVAIQQSIADAAWNSANAQIQAANAAKDAQSASTGSAGSVGGSSSPAATTVDAHPDKYWVYKKLGSGYSTMGEASSKIGLRGGDTAIKIGSKYYVIKWKKGFKTSGQASSQIGMLNGSGIYKRYASGTTNAKRGFNLVGEAGAELYKDNDGNISLITSPTVIPMEGGETVYNANKTKGILNVDDVQILPLKDDMTTRFAELMKSISGLDYAMPNIVKPDYSYMNSVMNNRNPQQTVIQNVNITLPNVTNDGGYNKVVKELQSLQLDARQFASRR